MPDETMSYFCILIQEVTFKRAIKVIMPICFFILQAAFGLNLNTIEDADEQFTKAADTILSGVKFKINNPLHKVNFFFVGL